MALPNTSKPAFPNMPSAPGAPSVPKQIGAVQNTVVSTISDIVRVINLFFPPQWGLFTYDGSPVLTASAGLSLTNLIGTVNRFASVQGIAALLNGDPASVFGVEFRKSKRISTAPQEQGAFLSYNKVTDPFQARVTYLQGGSDDDRNSFLQQVDQACEALDLFLLVMPDFTYPSINVVDYNYSRSSRGGMTLLRVEVQIEQVRVVGTTQFTQTATPNGAAPTNIGTVQGQSPPVGTPSGPVT